MALSHNGIEYLKDIAYNGFMAFEAMTERNLDSVVCGICPEICLGDENEKNCCNNSQVCQYRFVNSVEINHY